MVSTQDSVTNGHSKQKRASLSNVFEGLEITHMPSSLHPLIPISQAKSIRRMMKSTLSFGNGTVVARSLSSIETQLTVAMDDPVPLDLVQS